MKINIHEPDGGHLVFEALGADPRPLGEQQGVEAADRGSAPHLVEGAGQVGWSGQQALKYKYCKFPDATNSQY
jgi:hypothetical protein